MLSQRSRQTLLRAFAVMVGLVVNNALSAGAKGELADSSALNHPPSARVIEGHVESLNDISSLHQVFNRATRDALAGDRKGLVRFYNTGLIKDLPKPSSEVIIDVLSKAKMQTDDLVLAGSPRLAAQRLRLVFNLCANLAGVTLARDGDETLAWRQSFEALAVPQKLYQTYLVYYANLLIAGGEAACALSPLKHFVADCPDSAEAHKSLSAAYKNLHNKRMAYRESLLYQHSRRERIYTIGTIEGTYDKSVDVSCRAKALHGVGEVGAVADLPLTGSTSEVWRLGDEAVFDIKDGDLEAAFGKLETILQIEPGNLGAQANLACLLNNRAVRNSVSFDRSCQDLRTACLLMPANDISMANMEGVLKLIGLDPSSQAIRIRFGDLLLRTGDLPGALTEYKEALKLKNDPELQVRVDALIRQLAQGYLSFAQGARNESI